MTEAEAVAALQLAACAVAPAELHASAVADGCRAQPPKRQSAVPLAEVFADGDALIAAVIRGDRDALGAALRGLARRDGEAMLDIALVLHAASSRKLTNDAAIALAYSRSDRALEVVITALDGGAPGAALARSVHPDATRRLCEVIIASGVLAFEVRRRPTLAEWDALSDAERRAIRAMRCTGPPSPGQVRATRAISALGPRSDAAGVALIVRLFEGHPDDRIRLACAHALAGSRDPLAVAALDRAWADVDPIIASIAVRAALQRDLATAWQRFSPHIAAVVAGRAARWDERIVMQLLYACHGGSTPRTLDPDPLVVEPRFVDLAARLRRDPAIGAWARLALRGAPRGEASGAIERHRSAPAAVAPAVLPQVRDFVARYRAGEHRVWAELVGCGAAIAQHTDLRDEAYAVATEIMQRVRHNADAIRAALRAAGARVADDDPLPSEAALARVMKLGGALPIALEAFWRVCGSVMLIPGADDRYDYGPCTLEADGLSLIALDPLELGGDVQGDLDQYEDELAEFHPEMIGPLQLSLSPDLLHKQNISGGAPHAVVLPAETAEDAVDPPLLNTRYGARLVGYLRIAFRYGGFPGLDVAHLPRDRIALNEQIGFRRVTGSWAEAADRLVATLRRDLVEL